jgi:hypothetical protein
MTQTDRLVTALKQRYRRPRDALKALGLDAALLDEVHKEDVIMATSKLTPAAMVARSALFTYLTPRLAADSRKGFNFNALVKGITSRNYRTARDIIADRVRTATDGKLAQDADINDLIQLLQALGPSAETADQTVSAPTAGAPPPTVAPPPTMGGGGDQPLAGPPDEPGAPVEHIGSGGGMGGPLGGTEDQTTEPDDTVAQIKAYLEQEGVSADIINNLDAFLASQNNGGGEGGGDQATDQNEPDHLPRGEEDLEPRGSNESDLSTDDNDFAEDEPVPTEQTVQGGSMQRRPGGETRSGNRATGSDRIIPSAHDRAISQNEAMHMIRTAQDKAIRNQRAIRDAERYVRPWVGDLAMDANSAADVYRQTLKILGVRGCEKMHADALRPVLDAQPRPSQRVARDRAVKFANDAATGEVGDFNSRWGDATKGIRMQ